MLQDEACPEGFYRSGLIVFSCEGGHGSSEFQASSEGHGAGFVAQLPQGIQDFRAAASSTRRAAQPVGLQLWDEASQTMVVSPHNGLINASQRAGTYQGVGVIYSGLSVGKANSSIYLLGTLPSAMQLTAQLLLNASSQSPEDNTGMVLAYTFEGIQPCPSWPARGCTPYDEAAAERRVLVWSRWASDKYGNATEAWRQLALPHLETSRESSSDAEGVAWHLWPEVWSAFLGNPKHIAGESWQPAFRYLDTDGDGLVSQPEFDTGFGLSSRSTTTLEAASPSQILEQAEGGMESVLGRVGVWSLAALVCVMVLAAIVCCVCRMTRATSSGKQAARVISSLSRELPEKSSAASAVTGGPAALEGDRWQQPSARGELAPLVSQLPEDDASAARGPLVQESGQNLWLFPGFEKPSLMKGLAGLWPQPQQQSFRYGPLPLSEESAPGIMSGGIGLLSPTGQAPALSGTFAPGSLSLSPAPSLGGAQGSSVTLAPPSASSFMQSPPRLGFQPAAAHMAAQHPQEAARMEAMHRALAGSYSLSPPGSQAGSVTIPSHAGSAATSTPILAAQKPPAKSNSFEVKVEVVGPVEVVRPAAEGD